MKKLVATIFLFIYFVTSSGATIQLHYCMDKLVGWSLSHTEKSKCSKCGMERKGHKGCCHDESKFIKLDKVHKATFNYFDLLKLQLPIHNYSTENQTHVYVFNPFTSYPTNNAPPTQKETPIYIFDCVFRI